MLVNGWRSMGRRALGKEALDPFRGLDPGACAESLRVFTLDPLTSPEVSRELGSGPPDCAKTGTGFGTAGTMHTWPQKGHSARLPSALSSTLRLPLQPGFSQ